MRTRKMTSELQKLIDDLAAKVEDQNLQITALRQARQATPAPAPQPQGRVADRVSIPDPIKLVPVYAGEPEKLQSWIASVDQKIDFSIKLVNDPTIVEEIMPLWVGIIRDKITNEANEVLIRNQVNLEWSEIKAALKEELGDKRDLATLSSKISQLKQGSKDITSFYHECKKLLADINAKLLTSDETKGCAKILMTNYEAMIMTAFIDGLPDDLSTLTRIYRPKNLYEAYQCGLDLHNSKQKRIEKSAVRNTAPSAKPQFHNSNTNFRTVNNQFRTQVSYPPNSNYNPKQSTYPPNSSQNSRQPNFPPNNNQFSRQPNDQSGNQTFYQRPPFQPNRNYIPAIKQEPSSQQTRAPYRSSNNINAHEGPSNSTAMNQYLDYEQPQSDEQDSHHAEQIREPETFDEVNFCADQDHQILG